MGRNSDLAVAVAKAVISDTAYVKGLLELSNNT